MTTTKKTPMQAKGTKNTPNKKANKRIISNPLQYANEIIVRSNREPNCFVHIADQDKDLWALGSEREPLTPYLGWVHEIGIPNDPLDGLPVDGYGWQLILSGLKTGIEHLGYADWNDPEGIRHLVQLLEDKEALLSLATLRFPDAMAEATKELNRFKTISRAHNE